MSETDRGHSGPAWTGGDLARRVRRRRCSLGLSRAEVAERARMDPAYVERIESAPVALTGGALIRLAAALDTTLSELLGAQPERPAGHGPAALHPVLDTMREVECRRLIEPGGLGRVLFEVAGRLHVVPVNFGMHEGWSVVVTGTARQAGPHQVEQLRKSVHVDPWAGGDRQVYLVIDPEKISGRRIRAW